MPTDHDPGPLFIPRRTTVYELTRLHLAGRLLRDTLLSELARFTRWARCHR